MAVVSVIIPTFNRAHLVTRAIDSALEQTYPFVEVVVVDDGSTDNTREIITSRYGDRVKYIDQPNSGCASARNTGAAASKGEFLAFLDSDDTFDSTKLEKQVAYADVHPDVDVILSGWRIYDVNEGTIVHEVDTFPVDNLLESILLTGMHGLFPPFVALMRRECFNRMNGFDATMPVREEQDFWLRALVSGARFGVVEEVLCTYREAPEGKGKNRTKLEEFVPIMMEKIFSHPQLPTHIAALKNEVFGRIYLEFGLIRLGIYDIESNPEIGIASEYFIKAMGLKPSTEAWRPEHFSFLAHLMIKLAGSRDPETCLSHLMDTIFPLSGRPDWLERKVRVEMHIILAFQAHIAGQKSAVRHHVLEAVRLKPAILKNRGITSIFLRSLFGSSATAKKPTSEVARDLEK